MLFNQKALIFELFQHFKEMNIFAYKAYQKQIWTLEKLNMQHDSEL